MDRLPKQLGTCDPYDGNSRPWIVQQQMTLLFIYIPFSTDEELCR